MADATDSAYDRGYADQTGWLDGKTLDEAENALDGRRSTVDNRSRLQPGRHRRHRGVRHRAEGVPIAPRIGPAVSSTRLSAFDQATLMVGAYVALPMVAVLGVLWLAQR